MGVTEKQDLKTILRNYYLDYAKSTITERNFVFIDGLKPVQKCILYDMKELGIKDKSKKSARIVGDTMGKYHPHGDSSIYGALCLMTDYYNGLNVPWIKADGCFGKVWSNSCIVPSAMRYTEASFSKIAMNELFNGLLEDAVDFVPNFDETETLPALLPVSFPSIIVNTNSGIATGMASNIPCYGLKEACNATIAILKGEATKPEDIVDILDCPDYPTGGTINMSKDQKLELVKTGKVRRVYITGSCHITKNQLSIYELPPDTTCEKVIEQIAEGIKSGAIRGASNVKNGTGKKEMRVNVTIKSGYDPQELLRELYANSDLRMKVAYSTKFVHWDSERKDYMYKETGIFELLDEYWIPWKVDCYRRIYNFRIDKAKRVVHELEAWELIKGRTEEVALIAARNKTQGAREILMKDFGLDLAQANYILDKKLGSITVDNMLASLAKLAEERKKLNDMLDIVSNDKALKGFIIEDLERVIKNYGRDRKMATGDLEVVRKDEETKVVEISDDDVWIGITANGMIKRARSFEDSYRFGSWLLPGDKMDKVIECKNNDTLLLFSHAGYCYKIPVYQIENVRGAFRDSVWKYANKDEEDLGDIMYIDNAGDYTKWFNIVYDNNTGRKVMYKNVKGPRSKYKGLFEVAVPNKNCKLVFSDEFFIITTGNKAGYVDLTTMTLFQISKERSRFKLPRIPKGEKFRGVVKLENVVDKDTIDFARYKKPYCVSMRDDRIFWKPEYDVPKKSEEADEKEAQDK